MEFLAQEGNFYCSLAGLHNRQKLEARKKKCAVKKLSSLHSISIHTLSVQELSESAIKPYGQVIEWCEDGVPFGPTDAELCTSNEIPRLYVMRLRLKELCFNQITYHAKVTQCLGSFQQNSWYHIKI